MTDVWGTSMYDTQAYRAEQLKRNKELRTILDNLPINKIKTIKDIPSAGCLSAGPTQSYAASKPCFDTQKETKMTDFTKPVQTRSGLPVTIITTKGRGTRPVIGYMDASEKLHTWCIDGSYTCASESYDLINVPEKRVMLIHFIQTQEGNVFTATVKPELSLLKHIATKRVEYTEGQFDE